MIRNSIMKLRPISLALLLATLTLVGCKDSEKTSSGKPGAEQAQTTTLSEIGRAHV